MNEKRREEIRNLIDHFRSAAPYLGKPFLPEQKDIDLYCKRMSIERITQGDYQDYLEQIKHDDLMMSLFPKILAEVQKILYTPEFESEAARKKCREQAEEVRINIAKLFEQHAILYRNLDSVGKNLASLVGQTIEMAGQTIYNKAGSVLLHIAKERFGEDFNIQHARDYAEKVYSEAQKTK